MARKSAMKWNSFARTSPLRGPCGLRLAARETTMNNASPWTRFLLIVLAYCSGIMSWRSLVFCCLPCSKIVIHAKRVLLLVVKVVFVVFPNSAGRIGNSPTPLSLHFPDEPTKSPTPPRAGCRALGEPPRRRRSVAF